MIGNSSLYDLDALDASRVSFSASAGALSATITLADAANHHDQAHRLLYAALTTLACQKKMKDDYPERHGVLLKEDTMLFDEQSGSIVCAETIEVFHDDALLTYRSTVYRSQRPGASHRIAVAEFTQTWRSKSVGHASRVSQIEPGPIGSRPENPLAVVRVGGAEERHDRVLKAAYEVIADRGYAAATMREIAQAADLPIATVYLYIGSKEDLLFQISARLLGHMTDQLRREIVRHTSVTKTLTEAIQQYLSYCGENRRFINLVYQEGKSLSKENRQKIFDLDRAFVRVWEEIIRAGIKSGEFKADVPELTANFIYFLCSSWSLRFWNLRQFGESTVQQTLIDIALHILSAKR